eukprot:11173667-Lingulodinium_polyedra.AAC.1
MNPPAAAAWPSAVQPPQSPPMFCPSCQLWLANDAQWISHVAGKKHKRRSRPVVPARHTRTQIFHAQQQACSVLNL